MKTCSREHLCSRSPSRGEKITAARSPPIDERRFSNKYFHHFQGFSKYSKRKRIKWQHYENDDNDHAVHYKATSRQFISQVKAKRTLHADTRWQSGAFYGCRAHLKKANEELTEESIFATEWQKISVRTPYVDSADVLPETSLLLKENLIRDGANIANHAEGNNEQSSCQVRADLFHSKNGVHQLDLESQGNVRFRRKKSMKWQRTY